MDEDGAMNSTNTNHERFDESYNIKKEFEVRIKLEPHECVVCSSRTYESFDIFLTTTAASGTTFHDFLCKLTNVALSNKSPKQICKACFDLINVLEEAEIEYVKLKQTFEAIISKNPLFDIPTAQPINLATIKNEFEQQACENSTPGLDSEDEPLAVARKRRQVNRVGKRKKKTTSVANKRKSRQKENDSWSCETCGIKGVGGVVAETAHKLSMHTLEDITFEQGNVKTEDSNDGSQSTQCTNGVETADEGSLKLELMVDDDASSNYFPDDAELEESRETFKVRVGRPRGRPRRGTAPRTPRTARTPRTPRAKKVMHQCDLCLARYSCLDRLKQHREKHEAKPPYICEVCGAHYKHKRACDIHVALHRGISDWKCHECDKLFPSKGALHRHNNIHTGKPNYQCDLCGKSFIHTSSFKMHKLTHSGVKPHACDVCGLALMTRSHLKRHKRVHSGEKRHECPVCGKRFSERYNLAAHSKSHETSGSPVVAAPRRPMFRCAYCPERFERRYMLERHCGTVHGRPLERAPPTPRNTMSKLLKAQARRPTAPVPAPAILHALLADTKPEVKEDGSPEPPAASTPAPASTPTPATTPAPQPARKLATHGASAGSVGSSWAGAFCAEFALRPDYPQ